MKEFDPSSTLSSSIGSLYLFLPSRNLTAGSTLSGSIYLRLLQDLSASQITITLSGTEHCEWQPLSDPKCEAEAQKFSISRPVFVFPDGKWPAGDYAFPFQWKLDHVNHSSINLDWGSTKASIQYLVTARIEGGEDTLRIPNAQSLLSITRTPLNESIIAETSQRVKVVAWCCCTRGTVDLKLKIGQNGYRPGEMAECVVEVNNEHCSVDVEGMEAVLTQEAHLTANHLGKFERKIIHEQSIDQRVPSGQALLGMQSVTVKFPIPPTATSTAHGALIEFFTIMTVRLRFQKTCLGAKPVPEISSEVLIYPTTVDNEAFSWEDWQPTVMEEVDLNNEERERPGR